jgi:hypothetical protein
MTPVDVVMCYGSTPGESEMRAINKMHGVYGIRRIRFDEGKHTVHVEYDASRLTKEIVAGLLRQAGIELMSSSM